MWAARVLRYSRCGRDSSDPRAGAPARLHGDGTRRLHNALCANRAAQSSNSVATNSRCVKDTIELPPRPVTQALPREKQGCCAPFPPAIGKAPIQPRRRRLIPRRAARPVDLMHLAPDPRLRGPGGDHALQTTDGNGRQRGSVALAERVHSLADELVY
jgi:hypothetical protein